MERLNIIIFLFVLSVYGCSTTDTRNPRQIYFSNIGDTISLFSSGNTDKILIRSHGGEGRCDIINEPQPHIHGIAGDTIFIWYDYMHRVDNPDTNITGFIKQISIGQYRYVIKGVQNYFYNGNSIGRIDGMDWDYNYSYVIDSIVHTMDTIYFHKCDNLIYKADQSSVIYNYEKKCWEAFYASDVLKDGCVYKIKNCIRFIQR
jgi:hypothetical protein